MGDLVIPSFGEGFYIFTEVLLAYLVVIAIAAYSKEPLAWDAVKVLGGAVAAWGAQWYATRGQTGSQT